MLKTFLLVILMIAITESHAQIVSLPLARHKFVVIAHRGDHVLVPENTLAAYENGIKNSVDFVEIDLRTTKDSVLVIMHDATVDRMTNGKGKISDLTYAELKKLQVIDKTKGSRAIYRIPTFEEVLKTCRNKIYIYLDYKDASVQQAYKMIKQYGMEKQIIVYINTAAQYTEWRTRVPAMPLMLSLPEDVKTEAQLNKFLKETPIDLLDGDYSDYTPVVLGAATKAGITTWPDIQGTDEDKNWNHALEMGFTGLQTDHPAELIGYLKSKGLR
ncbi:MAG TPA: glycerophosphodiester phosphodiesterase family protein [Puia sp.]